MPVANSGLSDVFLKKIKSDSPQKRFSDGGGLFIQLSPNGAKLWRMAYRFGGKQKLLSFGAYPAVSLKRARQLRDEAKELLAAGIDPGVHKKALKAATELKYQNSFEVVAREWFEKNTHRWALSNSSKVIARLENDLFPLIGSIPVADLKAPDILKAVQRIAGRGALDTAHRALQNCSQILRYAIATGRAEQDVASFLRGALPSAKGSHYPTITDPRKIGALLRAIDGYEGCFPVACALKLMPLVFVRPGELRMAEWSEFDFEAKEWRIPDHRMKMNEQHIVPLAHQTLALLEALKPYTGHGRYLFPSVRTDQRPMSDNTINAALRRLGYAKEEMTGHGFRAMASTLLNEQGWNRDAIERQLAHGERNPIRAAYNYAEFLPERRKMMQSWADYLDGLRESAKAG
ncbi:tyrosine-type recombinase/integrase [Deltaproteobacteria bacterium OttesenSCG-928-K17]|nr:tyrosine-type recombinase/integrase [Deltaproteobacteria bacterium OttesenSCG-928-K17]